MVLACTVVGSVIFNCSSLSEKKQTDQDSLGLNGDTIRNFVVSTHASCLISLELANLAAESQQKNLRDLGNKMLDDNSKVLAEIKGLANSRNIALSDSISKRNFYTPDELTKKQGPQYDKAVARVMARELRLFSHYFRSLKKTDDEELKKFSKQNLPVIKEQISSLRAILKENNETSEKKEEKAA